MPNFIERLAFYRFNQGPGPLSDVIAAASFRAVVAALRLGVFNALSASPGTAAETATALGADPTATGVLLRTLASLGYLETVRGQYRITAMTRKWMLPGSPDDVSGLFEYFNDAMARWEGLEESIRDGRPPVLGREWLDAHPDRWRQYHAGMMAIARMLSGEVVSRTRFRKAPARLIDLGGSHGLYSIRFCGRYSRCRAVIYDGEEARRIAEPAIAAAGMTDRISFTAGDFVRDDIGSGYDAALLFNVIRIFTPSALRDFFIKICDSLDVGGTILVLDQLCHEPRSRFMEANTGIILLELLNSTTGTIYDGNGLRPLLEEAGFVDCSFTRLKRSPGLGLMSARKC